MNNEEQEFEWKELREYWNASSQGKTINLQMSQLMDELEGKVSQFEKDSINSDLAMLKTNWGSYLDSASQFEKDSIKKDLAMLNSWFGKFLRLFLKEK